MQEHYPVIVGKREESKVFGYVWERNHRGKERGFAQEIAQNLKKRRKRFLGVFIAKI